MQPLLMRYLNHVNSFKYQTRILTALQVLLFFILFSIANKSSAQYIDKKEEILLMNKLSQSQSDTNRIQLLLFLGKYHTYKEGKTKKDLDSAYAYLSWARKLSDTLHLQYFQHQSESMIVTFLLNKGDLTTAEKRYQLLMNNCDHTGDIQCKADAMFRHAIYYSSADTNYEVAKKEYAECARIYHRLNEHDHEMRQYYELAFVHFKEDKQDLAIKELLNVVNQAKAAKFDRLPETYTLLSKIYRVKGDFNKGLKYAILATEAIQVAKKKRGERYYYDDLARMYQDIGEKKQALVWYDRAVSLWRKQGLAEYGMYLAQGHLITELIAKGDAARALYEVKKLELEIPPITTMQKAVVSQNLAICYDGLKQHGVAETYFLKADNLYKHSALDFEGPQELYPQIAKFYIAQKEYKKANIYLQQSLNFNPQKLSLAAIRDVHYMLFKVDSANKNYISAIDHQRIGKHLDDSLLNRAKLYEIVRLQVQFRTKEMAEEYQNQTKFQAIKLQQVKQNQNIIIGLTGVLFIIILLLLNRYSIKQRSNKQLQASQIEINKINKNLLNLVKEKQWLIKEIHHRVKNNFQTIYSLLESQTGFLRDDALVAVRDSQHRINAMSLIHQKLYLSENATTINMTNYIRELINYLNDSFNNSVDIYFDTDVESINLEIGVAIPLGLIINEAITNSLKHAFKTKKGTISIKFIKIEFAYFLNIADNGIGLPPGFTLEKVSNSLGMTLINGLCKQILADLSIVSQQGTTISISFPA
jgi:two-component sensor histidine kinase